MLRDDDHPGDTAGQEQDDAEPAVDGHGPALGDVDPDTLVPDGFGAGDSALLMVCSSDNK